MKIVFTLIFLIISSSLFSQDLIIKTNKETIEGKVIEILDHSIKYKKQSNLDGPIYNLNKEEVFLIKYKNGEEESFEKLKRDPKSQSEYSKIKTLKKDDPSQFFKKAKITEYYRNSQHIDLSGNYSCNSKWKKGDAFSENFEIELLYKEMKKDVAFQFKTTPENSIFHSSQEFILHSEKIKKNKLSLEHFNKNLLPNYRYRINSSNKILQIEYVLYLSNGNLVYLNGIHPALFSIRFYVTNDSKIQIATFIHANENSEWLDQAEIWQICDCVKLS